MTHKYQTRNGVYDAEIIDRLISPPRAVVKLTHRDTSRQTVVLVDADTLKVYDFERQDGLDIVAVPPPTLTVGRTYAANNGPNPYEIVSKRGKFFVGIRDSTLKNAPPVVDLFHPDGTFYVSPDLKLEIPD